MKNSDILITEAACLILLLAIGLVVFQFYVTRIMRKLDKLAVPPKIVRHRPKRGARVVAAARILAEPVGSAIIVPNPTVDDTSAPDGGSQIVSTRGARQREEALSTASEERLDKWMPGVKRAKS